MRSENQTDRVSKKAIVAGWIIGILPVLLLLMSGVMKLMKPDDVVKGFRDLGWPDRLATGIGIVEIVCTVLYLIPQTAVLGAILLTGYLGGAIATHVRVEDPLMRVVMPALLGVLLWLGLYLRDRRLRSLIPIRK